MLFALARGLGGADLSLFVTSGTALDRLEHFPLGFDLELSGESAVLGTEANDGVGTTPIPTLWLIRSVDSDAALFLPSLGSGSGQLLPLPSGAYLGSVAQRAPNEGAVMTTTDDDNVMFTPIGCSPD